MRIAPAMMLAATLAMAALAWPPAAYAPQNRPPSPQEGAIDFAKAAATAEKSAEESAQRPAAKPAPEGGIDFAKAAAQAQAGPGGRVMSGASAALLRQDLEQQAKHLQWQRDYERRGWEWHLLSTQLLFGVVIVIVLFGLYITYVQFRRDYSDWEDKTPAPKPSAQRREPGAAPPAAQPDTPAVPDQPPPRAPLGATTLKLSAAGLEVTSQIVGLIVLVLSLAFFFLYVKEVYPIREVDVTKAASPPPQDTAPEEKADKAGK